MNRVLGGRAGLTARVVLRSDPEEVVAQRASAVPAVVPRVQKSNALTGDRPPAPTVTDMTPSREWRRRSGGGLAIAWSGGQTARAVRRWTRKVMQGGHRRPREWKEWWVDRAVTEMDTLDHGGCFVCVGSWNAVLATCAAWRSRPLVSKVLAEMDTRSVRWNVITFAILLELHCGLADWATVGKLRARMRSLGIVSDNPAVLRAMLKGCEAAGDERHAVLLLREERRKGVSPCAACFAHAIGACQSFRSALRVYSQLAHTPVVVEPRHLARLLRLCGIEGLTGEATEVVHEMKRRGFEPTTSHWNIVLAAHMRAGFGLHAMRRLLSRMPSTDAATFGTLAAAARRDGDWDGIVDALSMQREAGHLPDAATLTTLMSACVERAASRGDLFVQAAEGALARARERGIAQPGHFLRMMQCYAVVADCDAVERLRETMREDSVREDQAICLRIRAAYLNAGDWLGACRVLVPV